MVDGGLVTRLSPQIKDPLKLCPCVHGRWVILRDQCAAQAIPLTLIETLRAPDRQEHYIQIGASWTRNSKHLPQPPRRLSLAFDAAVTAYLAMKWWNPQGPLWQTVGELGEALGLEWGGRWRQRDMAHHQLEACLCPREG